MRTSSHLRHALLAMALTGTLVGEASALTITREFAGSWYYPAQSGHGFNFEVVNSGSIKTLLGYWYTYDNAGNPTWVIGTGAVNGDTAHLTARTNSGGSFNNFNAGNVQTIPWGSLTVRFTSCSQGTVAFDPIDPSLNNGSIPISRLTIPYNSSCSGGVSGDTSATANASEIVQFMSNTGVIPAAQGKLKFEESVERTEFSAEVEDLPTGTYSLVVAGVNRGNLQVVTVAGGTEAELEFRSPVEPGKQLLDFDPRGKLVQVKQGATVFLSATLGSSSTTPPPPPPGGDGSAPPFGNGEYEMSVEPGGNDGPELKARLRQSASRVDFNVELEDVPAGSYRLNVGGVDQGTIQVRAVAGGTEGELEFSYPTDAGDLPLDFDPRGKFIDILSAGQVVISGLFPSTPNAN